MLLRFISGLGKHALSTGYLLIHPAAVPRVIATDFLHANSHLKLGAQTFVGFDPIEKPFFPEDPLTVFQNPNDAILYALSEKTLMSDAVHLLEVGVIPLKVHPADDIDPAHARHMIEFKGLDPKTANKLSDSSNPFTLSLDPSKSMFFVHDRLLKETKVVTSDAHKIWKPEQGLLSAVAFFSTSDSIVTRKPG